MPGHPPCRGGPFSDEQLEAIAGVVEGLRDKALAKHHVPQDESGPSKGKDGAGTSACAGLV